MFEKDMQIIPEKAENRCTARLAGEFTSTEVQSDGGFIGLSDCEMHQAQLAYYRGFIATYMPNAAIYPHIVGMTPERVPLPLECEESFPIYVNSKQYHAILKRRKIRAKFEAQNKLATSRKPYIHKSRHLHALKRARGSGGRFLNTKTIQHSKSHQQLGESLANGEFQHLESSSWETSAPSISDVTSIFSGDEVFQQQEFKVPSSAFHIEATMPLEQAFALGRT